MNSWAVKSNLTVVLYHKSNLKDSYYFCEMYFKEKKKYFKELDIQNQNETKISYRIHRS
jgi:hypothetical protein